MASPDVFSRKVLLSLAEARQARELAHQQVNELAADAGFRRRYRDVMLSKILHAAIGSAHAAMGNIQLFDSASARLLIHSHEGFDPPFLEYFAAVETGRAACGAALQSRARVIVPDVTDSEIFDRSEALEVLLDSDVRSVQSTPLIGARGQLLGVLSTHDSAPGAPNFEQLHSLDYFAAWAAGLIEWHDSQGRAPLLGGLAASAQPSRP